MIKNALNDNDYGKRDKRGNWAPFGKLPINPKYLLPFNPFKFIFNYFKNIFITSPVGYIFWATAILSWFFLTPSLDTMKNFEVPWIFFIFIRNLIFIIVLCSFFHLRLYTFNLQGNSFKYNPKSLATKNPNFFTKNQLIDNIFNTLVWGVPIWTTYEVITLWAFANGIIYNVSWQLHPIYCFLLFIITPTIQSVHFYFVHRLLHWKPLYKYVHKVHHNNVNIGPWSGLSFHPIEHVFFFSVILIFWIIPCNPLIAIWCLFFTAFAPIPGHSGYDKMLFKNGKFIPAGDYNHQLHHKYFECNYSGSGTSILDKIFGTFHDGSDESMILFKEKLKNKTYL